MKGLYDPQYTEDPEETKLRHARVRANAKCTPDRLLDFAIKLGRAPTLQECKNEFGGIIGPMLDWWTLKESGRLEVLRPLKASEILNF